VSYTIKCPHDHQQRPSQDLRQLILVNTELYKSVRLSTDGAPEGCEQVGKAPLTFGGLQMLSVPLTRGRIQ
jgi:hypothetical protein